MLSTWPPDPLQVSENSVAREIRANISATQGTKGGGIVSPGKGQMREKNMCGQNMMQSVTRNNEEQTREVGYVGGDKCGLWTMPLPTTT